MKKIYTFLTLIFLNTLVGNAQTADLQLVPTMNCATNKLEVMVQIKAQAGVFKIGTSSVLLNYNKLALNFASYQSESFDKEDLCIANTAASWDDHVFDGTTAGTFNLTMTLLSNANSCPEITTAWLNVGKITFNVTNVNINPQLAFDLANTNFNSVPANDGSNPISKGVFTGYSPANLGCSGACEKPSAPVISATKTSVCGSETAILSTTTSCAVGSTLKWSNGAVTASITVSPGTYTAICYNDCGDSPASNSVAITSGTVPAAPTVSGGKAICGTEATTLSMTACNGTIKWYNGSTIIAGESTTTYVATAAGSYSATCANACGESDKAVAAVVTSGGVPATPAVAGGGAICAGGSTMLATSNCTGSVKWYNGATEIPGQTGTSYAASAAGSYSATCINACGESNKSEAAVVTITAMPAAPATVAKANVCPATTLSLSDLITATTELYTDAARATTPLLASAVAAVSSTSTYYLFTKSGSCYSSPATVTATVIACLQPASIGNLVWNDLDQNGVQNAGEPGLADVKVYLINVASASSISMFTNEKGKYSFTNLVPGDYSLAFNTPAGFMASPKNAGTDDTKDSDANLIDGTTIITNLTSAEADSTWDAGFYLVVEKGTIGDYVFNDVNNSGTQDAGDTPIGGVKIYLLNAANLKIDSTNSNLDGSYNFNVVSGTYSLQFVAPVGRVFSAANQGDDTKDSDAAASNGQTASVTIDTSKPVGDPARTITHLDAGLQPIANCVPSCIPISFKRM